MTDAADEHPPGGARRGDILLIFENMLFVRNPHNEIILKKMDRKMESNRTSGFAKCRSKSEKSAFLANQMKKNSKSGIDCPLSKRFLAIFWQAETSNYTEQVARVVVYTSSKMHLMGGANHTGTYLAYRLLVIKGYSYEKTKYANR